jgi:acyl-CoA thioester hydrolase
MTLPAITAQRSCTIELRPRYCECDPMGVVHHAAYIPWLEMGRTELLRTSGMTYAAMEEQDVLLVVVDLQVKYRASAKYDQLVQLTTRLVQSSRVKIEHDYELRLVVEGQPLEAWPMLLVASTTLARVDRQGKVQALPEWLANIPKSS